MSDFEERARRAGDGLAPIGTDTPDPAGLHQRLRRRRVARAGAAVLTSAAIVTAGVLLTRPDDKPGGVSVAPPDTTATSSVSASTTTSAPRTTTSSSSTTVPPVANGPELLAVHDGGVYTVNPATGAERLVAQVPDAYVAYRLQDGSIVVETRADEYRAQEIIRVSPDGSQAAYSALAGARLVGVGQVDGRDQLIVVPPTAPQAETGPLLLVDPIVGTSREAGDGSILNGGLDRASIADGAIIEGWYYDLAMGVRYVNLDGTDATGWPDLVDPAWGYPNTELVSLVAGPDGSRLVYLDGPPPAPSGDGSADPNIPWALVVVNRNGEKLHRIEVGTSADTDWHVDYDGRWAIVSPPDRPALLIDTTSEQPTAQPIATARGVLTIG